MTDPLETLRPEVRCATAELEDTFLEYRICVGKYPFSDEWQTVLAELLRLAKAEAELAALKARIAESQECDVVALCGGGTSLSHEPRESLVGKRVRLLVDEPQDDNAKEGPEC